MRTFTDKVDGIAMQDDSGINRIERIKRVIALRWLSFSDEG